jgi:hypothetical protein
MTLWKATLSAVALCACAVTLNPASAAFVTINTDGSVVATTSGMSSAATTGADMVGMSVTALFSDGSTANAIWAATGVGAGAAIAPGFFTLSESGSTFGGVWSLVNNYNVTLTNLTINAGVGNTVFDILAFPDGTTDSGLGEAFGDLGGPTGSIIATYSKIVALTGFAPVGDLFAILSVDFSGLDVGGIVSTSQLLFVQDTDNLSLSGDLQTTPVPAALPLFVTGLGALGLMGWRRKRKQVA